MTQPSSCLEQVRCCNRKPKCNEMITLTKEDLETKKSCERMGFVFAKMCDRHIQESYERSLKQ